MAVFIITDGDSSGVFFCCCCCCLFVVVVVFLALFVNCGLQVRLQESLPGEFIRIRLKIEQNCRLFWDIFSSAIMNDLFMTFRSRLKVDAKCVYQQ